MRSVLLVLLTLLVLSALMASPAGGTRLDIALPSKGVVGDPVLVIITGPPNTSFDLNIAGPGFQLSETHNLSSEGVYRFYLPTNNEGEYLVTVLTADDVQTRGIEVECGAECQTERVALFLQSIENRFLGWLGIVLVVIVLVESFRMIEMARDKTELARQLGLPTPTRRLLSTLRSIRMFLPGSLGARRVETNPRFAYQSERIKILDALHAKTKTDNRPITYEPTYDQELYQMTRSYASASKGLRDVMDGRRTALVEHSADMDYLADVPQPALPDPELVKAERRFEQRQMRDVVLRLLRHTLIIGVWGIVLLPPLLDMAARVGVKVWPATVIASVVAAFAGEMYIHFIYLPAIVMLFVAVLYPAWRRRYG